MTAEWSCKQLRRSLPENTPRSPKATEFADGMQTYANNLVADVMHVQRLHA